MKVSIQIGDLSQSQWDTVIGNVLVDMPHHSIKACVVFSAVNGREAHVQMPIDEVVDIISKLDALT